MSTEQILSSDGVPLEVSLRKAERRNKIRAVMLVGPLFLFLLITYVFPIGEMLFRSVDDRMITKMLPNTFSAIEKWDGKDLPEEPVYAALYKDLSYLKKTKTYGKIIARLNYEKGGFSSLIKKTVRKIKECLTKLDLC
jgi:putative spermidine/putrescine transport system permease protein